MAAAGGGGTRAQLGGSAAADRRDIAHREFRVEIQMRDLSLGDPNCSSIGNIMPAAALTFHIHSVLPGRKQSKY